MAGNGRTFDRSDFGYDRDNTGNCDAGVSEMVAGISVFAGRNTGAGGGYRQHVHETGKLSTPGNNKTRRQRQRVLNGGADQDRTDDLYNAIVALSQLSYGPTLSATQSDETGSAARRIFRRFAKYWQDPFSKFLSDRRRLIRRAHILRSDRRRLRQDQMHLRGYPRRYRHQHHHQGR